MKNYSHTQVFFCTSNMVACLLLSFSVCLGANITSVGSGNWNVSQTWSGNVVPQEGDNVFIRAGDKIDVTETRTIYSITFLNTSLAASILTVRSGVVLNVTGGILLQNAANNSTNATIQGDGKVNCGLLTVGSTVNNPLGVYSSILTSKIAELVIIGDLLIKSEVNGSYLGHSFFFLNSGSAKVNGAIVLYTDNENNKTSTSYLGPESTPSSGILEMAGEIPVSLRGAGKAVFNFNVSGFTVKYSRSGDQTIYTDNISNPFIYNNLTLSGSGVKNTSGDFQVNGVFTIDEGVTMNQASARISMLGSGSLVVNGTLDFTTSTGVLIPKGGMPKLTMGINGLIRTKDPGGLGKSSDAPFQKVSNTIDWDLQSISTRGAIEYYGSSTTVDDVVKTQIVTDLDYNNLLINGGMQIKRWDLGSNRTINGNLTILSDAPLMLASTNTLYIKGDWMNSGVDFNPGFGTVAFNGSSIQKVCGSSITSFNNLVIDNPSCVLLSQNSNVIADLTLNRGLLTIPVSFSLTLKNQRAFIKEVKGAPFSATKHIVTQVDKNGLKGVFQVYNIPANNSFLFPIGDGEYYLPATITPTEMNNYSATVFTGFTADGKPGVPLEETQRKNVVNVIWDITGTKNVATDIAVSWPKDQKLEGVNVLDAMNNGGSLGILQFSNGQWNPESGIYNAVSNTVTRTSITSFSPFVVGVKGDYPLPVHFSNVRVSEKPRGIQVEFTNLTESDVAHYEIERSVGGQVFYAVKKLLPVKNDYGCASYSWLDENSFEGRSVYRIKAVELTGKIIFSNPVSIILADKKKGLNVFSKSGQVAIQIYSLPAGKYRFSIVNAAGQVVHVEDVRHEGGSFSQTTSLVKAKAGVYIFCVQGPSQMKQKFIMQ